ncbi:MAG: hypothetical protein ACI93R_003360 [Flavobacteriales bacterium]|jgi:hypothetical protein
MVRIHIDSLNNKRIIMRHYLFIWELGSGFGHISQLLYLANSLASTNNKISFIVSPVTKLDYSKKPYSDYSFFTSPLIPIALHKYHRPPESYAEILYLCGYHNTTEIEHSVKHWSDLFTQIQPDTVIFDTSPTALIASRAFTFERIIVGNGFVSPPSITPLPTFNYAPSLDQQVTQHESADIERTILGNINAACARLNIPKLNYLYDIYSADKKWILGTAEFDPYSNFRQDEHYIGHIPMPEKFTHNSIAWQKKPKNKSKNKSKNKRIIAYLKNQYPMKLDFIQALIELEYEANIFISDLPDPSVLNAMHQKIHITNKPFDLSVSIKDCDIFVCHAGIGAIQESLNCEVPVFCIPLQQEQMLVGRKCLSHKLGGGTSPFSKKEKIIKKLTELIRDAECYLRVRAYNKKYLHLKPNAALAKLFR